MKYNGAVGGRLDKTADTFDIRLLVSPAVTTAESRVRILLQMKTFFPVCDLILDQTDRRGFLSGYSGFPPPLQNGNGNRPRNSQNKSDFLSGLKIAI